MSALRAVRIGDQAEHGSLSEDRDGAGDEVQDVMLQALARKIVEEIQCITRAGQKFERCARPAWAEMS